MFSPILATSSRRRCSTPSPEARRASASAARSFGRELSAHCATPSAKALKSGPRATKSVSQLTSTIAAGRASPDLAITTTPSAATRAAFLSALARPWRRMSSAAASRSPLVSTSAFLHSIMPAPVRSRSCLTVSAVMFMRSLRALLADGVAAPLAPAYSRGAPPCGRGLRDRTDLDDIRLVDLRLEILDSGLGLRRDGSGGGGHRAAPRRRLPAHGGGGPAAGPRGRPERVAFLGDLDVFELADRAQRDRRLAFEH